MLTAEDRQLVRRIYLAHMEEADKVVWNLTSHGHYSVKQVTN